MKIIRTSQLNLNYMTSSKKDRIVKILVEFNRLVNAYIYKYWNDRLSISLLKKEYLTEETFLSARLQQQAVKVAIENIKSVKNKKNKNKSKSEKDGSSKIPEYKSYNLRLDNRFLKIEEGKNTFDLWMHLQSLGEKVKLNLPSKRHKGFNNLLKKGYSFKNSGLLRLDKENRLWLDVFLEKEVESPVTEGAALGIDLGINSLLSTSEDIQFGLEFKRLQDELHRKKYLSKNWYKKNREIKNYINQSINKMNLQNYDILVLEDLRKINKNTRGRLNKTTRKYLSFWNRSRIYQAINNIAEENRILVSYVKPAYTSQICSHCHSKGIRQGEKFTCPTCGRTMNADINGAKNVLARYIGSL